ncbi:MAG: hypothetical protein IPJ65_04750 [Archangiaceae bacterium]|nr:hypothetical protein [Archangiaceae bacterium]
MTRTRPLWSLLCLAACAGPLDSQEAKVLELPGQRNQALLTAAEKTGLKPALLAALAYHQGQLEPAAPPLELTSLGDPEDDETPPLVVPGSPRPTCPPPTTRPRRSPTTPCKTTRSR